ncbi:MAG: hypothetical protein H6553_00850 [Chitinophagales bacterium]|nr:hypothetical protein [Chitinophagales bacterium]
MSDVIKYNNIVQLFREDSQSFENDEALKKWLSSEINDLINTDFEKLLSILYRIDVAENKVRQMLLEETESNAGDIIADLLIAREKQKVKTRAMFKQTNLTPNDDCEKW